MHYSVWPIFCFKSPTILSVERKNTDKICSWAQISKKEARFAAGHNGWRKAKCKTVWVHDWVSQDPNLPDPTSSLSHSMLSHKTRDFERLCDCEGLRIWRILCTDVNDLANFALSIPTGSARAMHTSRRILMETYVVNSSECSCATAGLRWSACGPTGPREFLDFTELIASALNNKNATNRKESYLILSMLGTAPKAITVPEVGGRPTNANGESFMTVEGQHSKISQYLHFVKQPCGLL